MFQICGDVEAVGFPVQNVYKMTYGDENATFEPLNPEPVNGYYYLTAKKENQWTWKYLTK